MARLIDADKLIEITKNVYCTGCSHYDSGCYSCWVDAAIDLLRDEGDSPTAYDVEKVVEQIEEYREESKAIGAEGMLSDIIEVVKRGGIDEVD